jgi:Cu2+-exporting ATPase
MLLSFILLGRTLEQRARFRAADALRSLVELQPAVARLISDPTTADTAQTGVEVPASYVQVGEWVQVLPGEKSLPTAKLLRADPPWMSRC